MSMLLKIILFCAQLYFIQSTAAQCDDTCAECPPPPRCVIPPIARNRWRFNPFRTPWRSLPPVVPQASPCKTGNFISSPADLAASRGGGFVVTSSSPMPPPKITISSNNVITGKVNIVGEMPFLGSTILEGPVQTLGDGAVTYRCGIGEVGIEKEDEYICRYSGPCGSCDPGCASEIRCF